MSSSGLPSSIADAYYPERFRRALRESERESRAKGLADGSYTPTDGPGRPDSAPDDPHDQR